eukprot:PhF_6_TR19946/c0_g1_i1/m.29037/K19400/LZTFL1; leucine zipper transcription factor-like protein 1
MEGVLAKNLASLSDGSKTVLESYFHWSKSKRDRFIKDLDYQYKQYKDCRIMEQSYNATEVEEVLQGMFLIIQSSINEEATSQAAMYAEYLRNVLLEADKAKVTIPAPVSAMDNLSSVQAMEHMENTVTAQPPKGRLAPLAPADDKAKALAEAQEEVKRLNEKVRMITEKYSAMMNEKTILMSENQRLREASVTTSAGGDASGQVRKLTAELSEARKELNVRLSSCTQFANLKKMIQGKNKQVRELRDRLSKYEKVDAEGDDDVVE